ncbi:hypothetical protein [Paraburkholderia fungorum]|uniref:hypothetical protein n=1 Tax=Paraburkholderia fungorum TaxID=134537 RepID=UPI001C1EEF95|nr:hypothetical protein [Paraburkholderia fungorum]MBU7440927.1 hypothetical protein [Paraburkholderia fungorum]
MDTTVDKQQEVRRGYAFLEAISKPTSDSPYARTEIVFDVVDAAAFDTGNAYQRAPEHLSIVRVQTTVRRLREAFCLQQDIAEGEWFQIETAAEPGLPVAWTLDAAQSYSGPIRRANLTKLDRLRETALPTGGGGSDLLSNLQTWCRVAKARQNRNPTAGREKPNPNLFIRAIDVGHANCTAIHVAKDANSRILGYYDVGAPVFFHHRTFPKPFPDVSRVPSTGFVALSHWDFDHYSLAVTNLPQLQRLRWYAPDQPVGPNGARLQALLGKHLYLISTAIVPVHTGINLWKGTGASSDRNNSGYVLRVERPEGGALITGDVRYDHINTAAKQDLIALGVTHHGGLGCANPPPPKSHGRAVVSYGLPNRYGHPSEPQLAEHVLAGWTLIRTAGEMPSYPRADVWLY